MSEETSQEIRERELSPAAIVVAVMGSSMIPPPPSVILAVTVMEYSVPSSRPVSVYIVSLVVRLFESLKHSGLLFE